MRSFDRSIARSHARTLILQTEKLPSHFIKRRIHSLLGIIPIGFFLLFHLYTYSKSLGPNGVKAYNEAILASRHIPFLVVLEVVFIYLPILLHAVYGFVILYQGRSNVVRYPYEANVRYVFQRLTGVIALFFIGYHVYATRLSSYFSSTPMEYLWMVQMFEHSWKVWFYLIGTTAISFHFANGVWTFLIVWGVTISKYVQRLSLYACMSLFIILTLTNWLVVANFTYHYQAAPSWLAFILKFIKRYLFG